MTPLKTLFILFVCNLFLAANLFAQDSTKLKNTYFQLTLIPPLGTNGWESFKTTNNVSVNIFAGVSGGLNGVEAGGFSNIILHDVKGVQGAGFANVTLNNLYGCQGSGFANVNLGEAKGAQLAGFVNYNQKKFIGVQGSGFANLALKNFKGAQLAGFANIVKDSLQGVQVSGYFNYAKYVKGAQIGFINVADSVDGISLAFLSIVKKGLHQLEISADELFYTNLAVRTGTSRFYNVFGLGFGTSNKDFLWNYSYGIGTSLKVNDKWNGDVLLSAQHISKNGFHFGASELYKLYIGAEYRIAKKFTLAAGPTFNLLLTDNLLTDDYASIAPYSMMNYNTSSDFNLKAWVGGRVALRFF
ncbi:MAG: hypothetical protein ACKOXB_04855 [Flavobacteriales bacterium]